MDLQELKKILNDDQIVTGENEIFAYAKDWAKFYTAKASLLLFPKTTEEVRDIILWARKHNVSLIPSGGRTGLSAGATAINNEVILSLEKMNTILDFDATSNLLKCQAGVITQKVHEFAQEKNLLYPVNFSAVGSSMIGGNIATNAGGLNVVRYGSTRQWVTSITAVTGSGEVLNLNNSLVKDATGYDLKNLIIGSEGTLAVVTEATLQLTSPSKESSVILLAVNELKDIMKIYTLFSKSTLINAFEMFTDIALSFVLKEHQITDPFDQPSPYYLLIDLEVAAESEQLINLSEEIFNKEFASDGIISQSQQQYHDLWKLRELISESLSPYNPYKNDVSVGLSSIPTFLQQLNQLMDQSYPNYTVVIFGHIGDGNLHINVLQPKTHTEDQFISECKLLNNKIFALIQSLRGSISAEHGVGLVKKEYLHYSRSAAEIEIMKGIKKVFDPDLILNPGKIFDIE